MLEREVEGKPSRGLRPVQSTNSTTSRTRSPSRGSGQVGSISTPKRPGSSGSSSIRPSPRILVSPSHVAKVDHAVKERKVFCIGGVYPAVRAALKKRGWIEKNANTSIPQYMRGVIGGQLIKDVDTKPNSEDETENVYTQRVLANYAPDFIWVIRRDNIPWALLQRDQTINRFPRAYFTTKVGIAACVQTMQWFSEPGLSDTFFPRCYRLALEEERQGFLDDFRLTACVGILRWFAINYEKQAERGVFDANSKVSCNCLDFAIRQLNNYTRMRKHEDIDWLLPPPFLTQHWEVFLQQYYNVVHQKFKLNQFDTTEAPRVKYDVIKKTLNRLAETWPTMTADGIMNLWICKPGARSRGKGIVIMNQLDKILGLLENSQAREANWVVQKYIEKPMLIYKTKFDMRQWFIVTDWTPLTVWFAKESYVRFCTKPFSLDDFHESIHLCNNAVQCKYQNALNRDPGLPEENMWDCYTFQAYLKTIGKLELWDTVIYPGMKEGILGVLLASQDVAEPKKNCFELYGADYMFTEDLKPWLIEINSCPCMAGSTSVTARMCAQCLEDTIKVVIDRKQDKNADTGMFEMIYRQNPTTLNFNSFHAHELFLSGKQMLKDVDWPALLTKHMARQNAPPRRNKSTPKVVNPLTDAGLTFTDLVQKLNLNQTTLPHYDTAIQRIVNQVSPRTPSTSGHLTSASSAAFGNKPKGKINDSKTILSVRKIILPQQKEVPSSSAKTMEDSRSIGNNNNNNTVNPTASNTSGVPVDTEKSGMIPLSYLMYNAKTNPITITDMIREYAEATSRATASTTTTVQQLINRKVIVEDERKPKKKVGGKKYRNKSPIRTKPSTTASTSAANKTSTTRTNTHNNKQLQLKPSGYNNNNNNNGGVGRAEDLSRLLQINNSLQPLSPVHKKLRISAVEPH